MVPKHLVTWNLMTVSYAQHGHDKDALELSKHLQHKGVKLENNAFVGVLFACSHVELLHEGYHHG